MEEAPKIPIEQLDVFAPFTVCSMGSAQGDITTTLEEVSEKLIARGVDPDSASVEVLEQSAGRSELPRVAPGQTMISLGVSAAKDAFEKKEIDPESIDGIICATSTADRWVPDPSKVFHSELKLGRNCQFSYTIVDACQSGQDGMLQAGYAVANQPGINRVLVIASEVISPRLNPLDAATSAIFSDLAAAVIIDKDEEGNAGLVLDGGVVDSSYLNALTLGPNPIPQTPEEMMFMDPRDVGGSIASLSRLAVKRAITMGNPLLEAWNKGIEDPNDLIKADLSNLLITPGHQPSRQMSAGIPKRLSLAAGLKKGSIVVPYIFDKIGNGSSATSLLAFQDAMRKYDAQNKKGSNLGYFGAGVGATSRFDVIRT